MNLKNLSILIRGITIFISIIVSSCKAPTTDSSNPEKPFDWTYHIGRANIDEDKVPKYTLPEVLKTQDGEAVTDSLMWLQKRRPEILELFRKEVYGRVPKWRGEIKFIINKTIPDALNGRATMKEVSAYFINDNDSIKMNILIYIPNGDKEYYPLFVGLNFYGNHTIHPDTNITKTFGYVMDDEFNYRAEEAERGVGQSRWPLEKIIESGYGLATIFYGDLDPDYNDGFQNGVQPLFYNEGQNKPETDEWGSISAWAWGLSRAMDYFETDPDINENQITVMGLSRLGKTALWAGAQDERFAIVISGNSGCAGAALFRRRYGETIHVTVAYAPQWYCNNFKKYDENEDALPVDQHMLLSLIAPRPLYVASSEEDTWADPKGEFLSAKYATPVYHLFNKKGIETEKMPEINQSIMNTVGYHIRSGKHDINDFDWNQYIDFADKHFAEMGKEK